MKQMIGQNKSSWWIPGIVVAVILIGIGYGIGRRSALKSLENQAGILAATQGLPTIEIEPIQPQAELNNIRGSVKGPQTSIQNTRERLQVSQPAAIPAIAPEEGSSTVTAESSPSTPSAHSANLESSDRVREIQMALKAAGFDPGPADGKMGPKTRAAIRDFQIAHGLQADGKVGPKTWEKLEAFLTKSSSEGRSR
jgi:murein L,D-transpeptidase YcbB/YkuD